MRFCYIDETGTHEESQVLVFVGLVIDATKRAKIEREARVILEDLLSQSSRPVSELKGHHLYHGKKHWKGVRGRHEYITRICEWYASSQSRLAISAIHLDPYPGSHLQDLTGLNSWNAGALHVGLQIQKSGGRKERNKGATALIFDQQQMNQHAITELLVDPPEFVDQFYGRGKREPAFDQVIDTPFFVESHHVPAVQIADVFATILRHYVEVNAKLREERFVGESNVLQNWWETLSGRFLDKSARLPTKPRSELAGAYREVTPACLT